MGLSIIINPSLVPLLLTVHYLLKMEDMEEKYPAIRSTPTIIKSNPPMTIITLKYFRIDLKYSKLGK